MEALILLFGLVIVVALALAPFLLPWPQRVRWMVANLVAPNPWGAELVALLDVTEVRVVRLETGAHGCVCVVDSGLRVNAFWIAATADDIELLQRWERDATPLLEIGHPDGEVFVTGPDGVVAGLRPIGDAAPTPRAAA